MNRITITISGPPKSGKSLIALAVEKTLRDAKIPVSMEKTDVRKEVDDNRRRDLEQIVRTAVTGKVKVQVNIQTETK